MKLMGSLCDGCDVSEFADRVGGEEEKVEDDSLRCQGRGEGGRQEEQDLQVI